MATVQQTMYERWRSGRYVAANQAKFYMTLRRGVFVREYKDWDDGNFPVKAYIPTHSKPYQATWTPTGPWRDVPTVFEVNIEQSFDNNGIAVATIQIEDVWPEEFGPGNAFHRFVRGYFSPMRGYSGPERPPSGDKNAWFDVLKRKSQVMIFGGYGDVGTPLFTGLINDVDLTSAPDRITVTARDFGQTLTDQHCFGTVKDKALVDPITFRIGKKTDLDDTKKVGGSARASSEEHNHPARFVCDGGATYNNASRWLSDGHDAPNVTEWVQIKIPRGRYLSFYMDPEFANMELFISIYVYDRAKGKPSQWNDVDVPQGWIDLGKGDVPGFHGGFPYIKTAIAPGDGKYWTLGGQLECGDRSVLRVSFRKLGKHRNLRPGHEDEVKYRAGVSRLFAVSRKQNEKKAKTKHILVDDVSDIVRVVLRWAGFKEWEIQQTNIDAAHGGQLTEETGSAGKDKKDSGQGWVFNQDTMLIDIIRKCQEYTGYTFYMRPPEDLEQIGIPVFRYPRALDQSFADAANTIEIRDTQLFRDDKPTSAGLLGAINAHFSDESLPTSIRVRGKAVSRGAGGVTLGGDKTRRLQFEYRPPWAPDLAQVIHHLYYQVDGLQTEAECHKFALLAAVNAAMKSATANFEIPMYPFFSLDEKVALVDTGTGLSTRVYIAQRTLALRNGEQRSARMTLGGSLMDTPEFDGIKNDIFRFALEQGTAAQGIGDAAAIGVGGGVSASGKKNLTARRGQSKPPSTKRRK